MLYFLIFFLTCFLFLAILHESIFISIFSLICVFLFSFFILILNGIEFLGFLYLIVYVGAIAVLFLFMVMMYDRSDKKIFNAAVGSRYAGLEIFVSFFCSLFFAASFYFYVSAVDNIYHDLFLTESFLAEEPESSLIFSTNLEFIGYLLYKIYLLPLIGASLILLIGMIGSILITQTVRLVQPSHRYQDIKDQLSRKVTSRL